MPNNLTTIPPPSSPFAATHAHTSGIYTLALTPTHLITTSRDHTARLWPLAAESEAEASAEAEIGGAVNSVSVSAETPAKSGGAVNNPLLLRTHTASVLTCATDIVTDTLITADGSGQCCSWRLSTGALVCAWQAHGEEGIVGVGRGVLGVGIRDGVVVTGAKDGVVRVWDGPGPKLLREWKVNGPVNAVVMAEGGRGVFLGVGDGLVGRWDTVTGERVRTYGMVGEVGGGVPSIALSADERRVVAGGLRGSVRVWDVESGEVLARWQAHEGLTRVVRVWPASEANGGVERIVSGSYDGMVKVWREKSENVWVEAAALDWKKEMERLRESGDEEVVEGWVLCVAMDAKKIFSCGLSPKLLV